MRVCKLGDGLAIPLPPDVVEALHLAEGDEIDIRTTGGSVATMEKKLEPVAMVQNLKQFSWMFPADFVFNRDEANER